MIITTLILVVAILHLKILQQREMDREFLIILCVAMVMLLPTPLWITDLPYHQHYVACIIKSSILFTISVFVIKYTYSIRLLLLLILISVSVLFDIGNLASTELYWLFKPCRYEGIINYYNGFVLYEILCIFWSDIERVGRNIIDKSTQNRIDIKLNHIRWNVSYYFELLSRLFKKAGTHQVHARA